MQKSKFAGLMVKLASSDTIEKWSHGVVDHADTINYRTGKPKPKGLFCEAIFGPIKNFECSCGKYKGVRYKGIVCERCGVEVTTSRVRRERMGHIELAAPVVHVRYQNGVSGGIHHLLGLSGNEIQKILSYVKYIVVKDIPQEVKDTILQIHEKTFADKKVTLDELYEEEKKTMIEKKTKQPILNDLDKRYANNKASIDTEYARVKSILSDMKRGTTILESDYRNIFVKYTEKLMLMSGPHAIQEMLKNIDVEQTVRKKLDEFRSVKSADAKKKAFILIKLLINLYASGVKPSNMILSKLPVIPPDLRPVVQLDGGRFASSDVNLFYRRVLMRNIRLKKMIQVGMPDVVKKNEIRLLQESINNLFVGEKNTAGKAGAGVKLFKSLSDMLSGKEGIFRKNLLGKRVDYSGRSVITVGPHLKLDECGVPLYIAMKMFMPFVIGKLIEKKIVYTPKQAEKVIKDENPIALKLLDEVIKDKYVLLNRAPTLHRLSIEAFKIKLMTGKTIRLHPLVCPSFNADFDGDQMAIHLPISDEAQQEARELIAATKNILKPSSGEPTIAHSQDMVLGIYYLTDDQLSDNSIKGRFSGLTDSLEHYLRGDFQVHDKILLSLDGKQIETTFGRVLFNSVLPKEIGFINKTVSKNPLQSLLNTIFDECGAAITCDVADKIKDLGFEYGTKSGLSISALDIVPPKVCQEYISKGNEDANKVYNKFHRGFLSDLEKHILIVQIRTDVKNKIEDVVKDSIKPGDNLYLMIDSGARGSYGNTTQISGMKGLVLNPQGRVIELPITGNYIDGLSPIEYFISNHASRKGKADTALKTAESGYLTRKLCDACQEVIVREVDCGTTKSLLISKIECESKSVNFLESLYGRTIAQDIVGDKGVVIEKNSMITKKEIQIIDGLGIDIVEVRSPLSCLTINGVCQKCYGMDLATRKFVDVGSPVGIIAAQSLGEPATQLTMRTFHDGGGVASKGSDMTQGIDRVKQLFEIRLPKNPAIIAPFDGTIRFENNGKIKYMIIESEYFKTQYYVKDGYKIIVTEGTVLKKGGKYSEKGTSKQEVKQEGIVLEVDKKNNLIVLGHKVIEKKQLTGLTPKKTMDGDSVYKGEVLTDGVLDIRECQEKVSDIAAQKYIIDEITSVYAGQGQDVNDKHIEIVVKQLFSKVFIEDAGNTFFVPGTYIKYEEFIKVNQEIKSKGLRPAVGKREALGLTQIAKNTDSRLSAASFQETIRVMVDASLKGSIDHLNDLKSNVIIGRLLPLGKAFVEGIPSEADVIESSE